MWKLIELFTPPKCVKGPQGGVKAMYLLMKGNENLLGMIPFNQSFIVLVQCHTLSSLSMPHFSDE